MMEVFIVLFLVTMLAVWGAMATAAVSVVLREGSVNQRRARRATVVLVQAALWCFMMSGAALGYAALF